MNLFRLDFELFIVVLKHLKSRALMIWRYNVHYTTLVWVCASRIALAWIILHSRQVWHIKKFHAVHWRVLRIFPLRYAVFVTHQVNLATHVICYPVAAVANSDKRILIIKPWFTDLTVFWLLAFVALATSKTLLAALAFSSEGLLTVRSSCLRSVPDWVVVVCVAIYRF